MMMKQVSHYFLLAALLAFTLFGTVLAADSVVLQGYEFRFLGAVDNPGGTSTWTYAVTADGVGEPSGLSHWTLALELDACMSVVAPTMGPYVTPVDHSYCSTGGVACLEGVYSEVEAGKDTTTGVRGVKFGDAGESQLSVENPGTHIFEIELSGVPAAYQGETAVGVKTGIGGGTGVSGLIIGPTCTPGTLAISLADVATGGEDSPALASLALLLLAGLLAVSVVLIRRRMPA